MAERNNMNYEELYERQLPYSLEAEQSVLGALIIKPDCISDVLELVNADSFYRRQHRELFSVILRLFSSARPIDPVVVLDESLKENIFENEGEAKVYLSQLAQVVPTTANVTSYARIVQEKYYLRRLIEAGREMTETAMDGQADARTLLDAAEQKIYDIRQGRDTTGLVPIETVLYSTYDHLQKLSGEDAKEHLGIPTGFAALDQVLVGLNKSDLILLAARPAMGKTAFALNIASNVAIQSKKAVAMFSLEMSSEQLVSRILSAVTPIPGMQLRNGRLSPRDWGRLAESMELLSKTKMYIDDTPGITVAEMKGKLRRIKDLGLVVIDYLQLITSGRRSDNRVQEVSEITRSLKNLAKELNVPVLCLSQLTRGPDSRTDHRPMLADLRESGSIEQDADIVLFLFREGYYNKGLEDTSVAECIVAKNRHGEVRSVDLHWDDKYTRFSSPDRLRDDEG